MSRGRKQDRINKGGIQGLQKDLFGGQVHILNVKETFRLVKCGRCGNTVKMSQAKIHLSYGKALTICKACLELEDKERKSRNIVIVNNRYITNSQQVQHITGLSPSGRSSSLE